MIALVSVGIFWFVQSWGQRWAKSPTNWGSGMWLGGRVLAYHALRHWAPSLALQKTNKHGLRIKYLCSTPVLKVALLTPSISSYSVVTEKRQSILVTFDPFLEKYKLVEVKRYSVFLPNPSYL